MSHKPVRTLGTMLRNYSIQKEAPISPLPNKTTIINNMNNVGSNTVVQQDAQPKPITSNNDNNNVNNNQDKDKDKDKDKDN